MNWSGIRYETNEITKQFHTRYTSCVWDEFDDKVAKPGEQYRSFSFWLGIDGDVNAV